MNLPQAYTCSPSWTLVSPPSPYHPSGSSQITSPKHPVSCIEPGLGTHFIHDIIHVSMPFSQIIPPSPSPTESKRLFYTSVSLLLSRIQGYCYHLSKFHIYALVYCIGVFLSGLLQPPVPYLLGKNHLKSKLDSGACASCRFSRFQITGKINLYTDSNSSRDWKKRWKNEYNFKVSTKSPQILRFLIWN